MYLREGAPYVHRSGVPFAHVGYPVYIGEGVLNAHEVQCFGSPPPFLHASVKLV